MKPEFTAKDAATWRKWLAENHATNSEIWLVFFKKHSGGFKVVKRGRRVGATPSKSQLTQDRK